MISRSYADDIWSKPSSVPIAHANRTFKAFISTKIQTSAHLASRPQTVSIAHKRWLHADAYNTSLPRCPNQRCVKRLPFLPPELVDRVSMSNTYNQPLRDGLYNRLNRLKSDAL